MSALLFLTIVEVLDIHNEQIGLYGGESGVRDIALLESALASPQAGMNGEYFHADIFDMAAVYLHHIVQNHPFVDGNKRIGLACSYLFLALNGYELGCNPDDLAEMVLNVAKGNSNESKVKEFLRSHTKKTDM